MDKNDVSKLIDIMRGRLGVIEALDYDVHNSCDEIVKQLMPLNESLMDIIRTSK